MVAGEATCAEAAAPDRTGRLAEEKIPPAGSGTNRWSKGTVLVCVCVCVFLLPQATDTEGVHSTFVSN